MYAKKKMDYGYILCMPLLPLPVSNDSFQTELDKTINPRKVKRRETCM